MTHGLLTSLVHHAGDMGNFLYTPDGKMTAKIFSFDLTMNGKDSIIGKSVVLHQDLDDGGLGNATSSNTTGNSGARIACATILKEKRNFFQF